MGIMETKQKDVEPIVRLGSAAITCSCGNRIVTDPVVKYMHEGIMRLQSQNTFKYRSAQNKLYVVEAILGFMFRFGWKEIKREKITENGYEYIDIYVEV